MPPQHTHTRSVNARMTDDDFAPIAARAARLGTSTSEALRELVAMGALLELAQTAHVAISDDAQAMIARREPLNVAFARDPDDPENGPLWIVTPEEIARHEAASA
jgi:hypothetical protein